jgi:MYXO-CTERM domain-containing protein
MTTNRSGLRWAVAVTWAALGTLLGARSVGAFHLEDALHGGTMGHAVGGSFAGDGWHVTDRRDRIWYALPRLVSGSVEFTLANVTMASLTDTSDTEVFAMYEAGYGIAEPIRYAPEFRENHFKCMLRIYANGEGARAGQQKLMWGICPSGAPGYGGCGCGSFFEEPFGGNGSWDGTAQRLRIEWGGGRTRYLRNGAEVLSIDWSGAGAGFGPSELHLSLGTSRPSAVDSAQLPVGAVFSDLVVDGVEGELARCPGATVADAGTMVVDSGTPMMSGMVMDLPAVEDVTVDPLLTSSVYPDVRDLAVGAADSEFYVKFRVPSLPGRVVQAQLRLNSGTGPSSEGSGASVFAAASEAWSESTLTWSARPGPRGPRLARVDGVSVNEPYTLSLPVSAVSSPGTYAFAVLPEPGDTNAAHFDSKEVSAGRGPVLRLVIDPTMPPVTDAGTTTRPDVPAALDAPAAIDAGTTTRPDVPAAMDTGATAVDAGVAALDAGTATDLGDAGGDALHEVTEGDCSCRAGSAGSAGRGMGAVALVALALAGRRRRR